MFSRFMILISLFMLLSTPVSAASPRSRAPRDVLERISGAEKSLEALHSLTVPRQCKTLTERRSCDAFQRGVDSSLSAVIEVRTALGAWRGRICATKGERADCKQSARSLASIDAQLEVIRNKRQEFTTAFENFDQKANQLFNILSTVLKNEKEAASSISRNID